MKFTVVIEETLARRVEVEADNADEAIKIVDNQYSRADIVLDADDYVATEIFIEKEND